MREIRAMKPTDRVSEGSTMRSRNCQKLTPMRT